MSTEHKLYLTFKTGEKDLLYEGISWYRKNIVDQIEIRKNQICITFLRNSRASVDNVFYGKKNPARFEMIRALCFYYAVVGEMPKLKSAYLMIGNDKFDIDAEEYSASWPTEKLAVCLAAEDAALCFLEGGKEKYVTITYFIKSQLCKYGDDMFKTAWGGLNALYGQWTEGIKSERGKLDRFNELIKEERLSSCENFFEEVETELFWHELDWYNYLSKERDKKKSRIIDGSICQDKTLYGCYCKQLISDMRPTANNNYTQKEYDSAKLKTRKNLEKKKDNLDERIKFLIGDYCYTNRNRRMHGAKACPIFVTGIKIEETTEGILSMLILNLIKDLFARSEDSFK